DRVPSESGWMYQRRSRSLVWGGWLHRLVRSPGLLFVNHRVQMLLHNLLIFGLRQGDNFLSFANRFRTHVFLETRSRKNVNHADWVVSDIVNGDPCIGRDEDSGTTMHFSHLVAQSDLCRSVL